MQYPRHGVLLFFNKDIWMGVFGSLGKEAVDADTAAFTRGHTIAPYNRIYSEAANE